MILAGECEKQCISGLFLLPNHPRGTKGDNGVPKDLGSAKKVKGEKEEEFMEVEVITEKEDIEQLWMADRISLYTLAPDEKQHPNAVRKQSDHDRNGRTNVLVAWIGTNT